MAFVAISPQSWNEPCVHFMYKFKDVTLRSFVPLYQTLHPWSVAWRSPRSASFPCTCGNHRPSSKKFIWLSNSIWKHAVKVCLPFVYVSKAIVPVRSYQGNQLLPFLCDTKITVPWWMQTMIDKKAPYMVMVYFYLGRRDEVLLCGKQVF